MLSSSIIALSSSSTIFNLIVLLFCSVNIVESIKCYSCASENLQNDFMTRRRRPPGNIIALPKLFDNNCDLDTWILRTKAEVDCPGTCYKWQQTLNNSGVYSYMTVRACYEHMFGASLPSEHDTTCTENTEQLQCLAESSLITNQCYCRNADHCNFSSTISKPSMAVVVSSFLMLIMFH